MEIEIKQEDGCRRGIQGAATAAEVQQDADAVIEQYRQVSIPGFRQGRAPMATIEQRYHGEIAAAIGKRAAARLLREALSGRDMVRVGPARFTAIDFDRATGLTFTGEFDVTPNIDLPDFKSFSSSGQSTDDGVRKDELSEYLLEGTAFDLPKSIVEQEMNLAAQATRDQDQNEAQRRVDAERRVKLLLILQALARAEGIEVDDRDVDERIAAMAESCGSQVSALRTELQQNNGLERLKLFLLAEQTMDYILENGRK